MTERDLLPDGLYLHLDENEYFAQRRLGSSDIIKLFQQREGWWWSSHLNVRKIDKPKDELNFGKALHAAVLEGVDAYASRFAVAPDKSDFKDLCVTVEEIKKALTEAGVSFTSKDAKPALVAAAREQAPHIPVWEAITADFEEDCLARGVDAITANEDWQVRMMAELVHTHGEIGPLFAFGPEHIPLAEVSILWTTDDGIRRRGRLDGMLPRATGDLKTLGNWSGRPLSFEAGKIANDRGLDIQMADHHVARRKAYEFIQAGQVHGATPTELAWLKRFPTEAPHWGYFWIFYQKPDDVNGRAPVIFPWWEDYGDDLHRFGHRKVHSALETYRRCMAEHGPTVPWTRVERLHVTTEGNADRVFVPHYIAFDKVAPDEELALA
jgi:hypothetical protein